ncbi:negative elongation factor A-like [Ptychodera flava]|uniref:negative elongation factor A-like n=1 Tax=Ptychodera flava TaxID=63121 RepID=UPI00396A0A72
MASVRESDTSLWLHNKLGDNDDLWSGISSFSSQLNRDVLQNIQTCFLASQTQVKLKLLLSFLHMHRRNVEELQSELEDIIEQALQDDDEWVRIIADILRTYPSTGRLNLDIEHNHPSVADALVELRRIVSETDPSSFLPMECQYLNRNALTQLVGLQPPPVKHFALKRKPKSAALRSELLQKSFEAQAQQRKQGHSTPVAAKARLQPKKTDNHTPLRGIPKTTPTSGFRSHANLNRSTPLNRSLSMQKERGTKLLDINEQPMGGGREAKRRKKMQEIESMQEQMKKDKEAPPATPEYAASLMSPAVQKSGAAASTATSTPTPSYVPGSNKPSTSLLANIVGQTTPPSIRDARENLQQQLQQQLQQSQLRPQTTVTAQLTQQPSQQQQQQQKAVAVIQPAATTTVPTATTTTATPSTVAPAAASTAAAQPAAKKGLSLTREQMLAAQEMFRLSNKVTRPEKALILGFMAGSRENPCPQQGDIVTIKLSENHENSSDGTPMTVDSYFEMNYSNGQWKRYKTQRPL